MKVRQKMSILSKRVHATISPGSIEDTRQGETEHEALKDLMKLYEIFSKAEYSQREKEEMITAALMPTIESMYDLGFDSCLKVLSNGTIDLMQEVREE